ncbi:MAG: flagellar hook-length control protein FliK [Arenicella sp.]|jgi:flagellar hook-length control protein FliK
MMQHVATAKSEIAAFATGAKSGSFKGSESNEQFGKLLQDQKSVHTLAVASEAPTPHSPRKQALQQSIDETEKVPSSASKESTKKVYDAKTSSSPQDKTAMQSASEGNTSVDGHYEANGEANDNGVSESVANSLKDELKDGNTKVESELISSLNHNDTESASIAAQEWVSLVDELQKLAEIARSAKQSLAGIDVESLDVSVADLMLANKVDKGLLEQVNELHSSGNVDEELVSRIAKEQNQKNLAIYIQKALEQLTAEAETGQGSPRDIQQKTAESLLEQPSVLQDLLNQLQIASQKNGADSTDQKALSTGIDQVIEKDLLSVNQQVETGVQVDLTSAENEALLRTLLVDADMGKNPVQGPAILAKPVLPDIPEKLTQAQQAEALLTKLESVAEQGELLEQDSQMAQVATSNLLNSSKIEKVTNNNDLQNILNLTDNKLNKILENIAQRVFDGKKSVEPTSPEQIAQQIVIPKVSEITSSVESSSKEFISALKSGIEEFKNQLSQGREPGIDLKALVSDALAKTTDSGAGATAPINLEKMVNSVSQVLDFAQTMNRAIEHHHDQVYNATIRDAAQIQGEQSKQIQLNQFESKFEKAINIAKPEGHLQLAEKVRWMVNTKNLVAEIRLDPAELGSVNVKIAVSGESATVNFVVQSQQARDAVDNATPRLREMLAEKGIELGQSSVHQESDDQQEQGDAANQGGRGGDEAEDIDVSEQVLVQHNIVNGALGGIDYFV